MPTNRKIVALTATLLIAAIAGLAYTANVKGYTKKDGTYVRPHERRSPGSGKYVNSVERPSTHVRARHYDYSPHNSYRAVVRTSTGTGYTFHTRHAATNFVGARDSHGRIVRSESAKREFMRMTGYPHGRPGYVVDHITALKRGGSDTPSNMQWQTVSEAKAKDKWE
jgi:hypothetical protein